MTYTAAEGRAQILDELAGSIRHLATALAAVGEAYELVDETTGDRLEEVLFRPLQSAFGRAKRTHADFAGRYDLPGEEFPPGSAGGVPSHGMKSFITRAMEESGAAAQAIAELQDSMLPVEVGDAELRAGLAEVRVIVEALPAKARDFTRTLGR